MGAFGKRFDSGLCAGGLSHALRGGFIFLDNAALQRRAAG
jgi:hypothetical protein